jgi:hypothetical protein
MPVHRVLFAKGEEMGTVLNPWCAGRTGKVEGMREPYRKGGNGSILARVMRCRP